MAILTIEEEREARLWKLADTLVRSIATLAKAYARKVDFEIAKGKRRK